MRTGSVVGLATVLLLGIALFVPAAQGAPRKHGVFTFPASGPNYAFSLRDKAGFRLNVESDSDGSVVLTVSRHQMSNAYIPLDRAPAGNAPNEGEISADLGSFGRVEVEFRPSGKSRSEKPFPGCHGGPAISEPGVFVGLVRFRGEGGFVEFHAVRVPGAMTSRPRWRCPGLGHGGGRTEPEPREAGEEAALSASTPDGSLSFFALGIRGAESSLSPSAFFASMRKRYPHLVEIRDAFAFSSSAKRFEFDQGLATATVRPGAPFHGSAAFRRGSAGVADQWTGSLRVSFLGLDEALTGKRIEASLTRPPKSGSAAIVVVGSRGRQALLRRVERRLLSLP